MSNAPEYGINFLADLHGSLGLSEAARSVFGAVRGQQIPFSYVPVDYQVRREAGSSDFDYGNLPQGIKYPVSVLFYNVNVLQNISASELAELTGNRYTIGYWFWELSQMPDVWADQFERINEIWVATRYVQEAMLRTGHKPVHVIPTPVEITASSSPQRAQFGIPENRYTFLFSFSATSSDARKNPWGVISAFERAFGAKKRKDGPLLVMKVHHADMFPSMQKELRKQVARVGGILLENAYTRQEVNDLLACADVYASLHRGEGLGLGMAEAMSLGKPVIGTAYSGNVDFMKPDNSYLVDYQLRPITNEDHRHNQAAAEFYTPGLTWAEPDIDQAAAYMQHLYEDPAEGRARGQRAAAYIKEHYSRAAVARKINERLASLYQNTNLEAFQRRNTAFNLHDAISSSSPAPRTRLRLAVWRSTAVEWSNHLKDYFDVTYFEGDSGGQHATFDGYIACDAKSAALLGQIASNTAAPRFVMLDPIAFSPEQGAALKSSVDSTRAQIVYRSADQHILKTQYAAQQVAVVASDSPTQTAAEVASFVYEILQATENAKPNAEPPKSILFRFQKTAPGTGWYPIEKLENGHPFQWMNGARSTLTLYLEAQSDYRVSVCIGGSTPPRVLDTLKLSVNEVSIPLARQAAAQHEFADEAHDGQLVFEGIVPLAVIRKNATKLLLTLTVDQIFEPAKEGYPADTRTLGAQVLGVALSALAAPTQADLPVPAVRLENVTSVSRDIRILPGDPTPICTIISKNYIAQARALARSYLDYHPGGTVFVCLVDRIDGYYDPAQEPFTTVLAEDLNIPQWDYFSFQYTIMELNTAVKPYLLQYLMEAYKLDRLVYFDPDIVLYDTLARLDALLDQHGVVLTPHILAPLDDDYKPSELDLLQAGVYNLGFIAISRRTEWQALLLWWQERLHHLCKVDFNKGLFVDQRWIDLAPALFSNVHIWQEPAANIAYWNYAHRRVEQVGTRLLVGDSPVLFIHYSGIQVDQIEVVSKHQTRFTLADLSPTMQALMRDYRQRLLDNGHTQTKQWPYAYACFENGVPIPEVVRNWYWTLDPAGERWPTPYQVGEGSFFQYLNAPHNPAKATRPYLTNLIVYLYRGRPDLLAYFPTGLTNRQDDLMSWFRTDGYKQFKLPEAFLLPLGLTQSSTSQAAINPVVPAPRAAATLVTALPSSSEIPSMLRHLFNLWDARRAEAMTFQGAMPGVGRLLQRIGNMRVIGVFLKTFKQAMRLGVVWDAQRNFYQALVEKQVRAEQLLTALNTYQEQMEVRQAYLDAQHAQLDIRQKQLDARHAQLDTRQGQIEAAHTGLQTRYAQLNAGQSTQAVLAQVEQRFIQQSSQWVALDARQKQLTEQLDQVFRPELERLTQNQVTPEALVELRQQLQSPRLLPNFYMTSMELESLKAVNAQLSQFSYLESPAEHRNEKLYIALQTAFRGSEQEIADRQRNYLPYLTIPPENAQLPIADIGCGRGEFLSILRENGLYGIGVETNELEVRRLRALQYEVVLTDAVKYLDSVADGSLAGITAFQVIEHVDHDYLMRFLECAHVKLAKGGFILLETVNPMCLETWWTFWLDPTHVKPIPPYLLTFLLNFTGFKQLQGFFQSPLPLYNGMDDTAISRYRDYALMAIKQ